MESLEEDFMRGWYAATTEANLKIHHHFNVDDDELMKDFLNGSASPGPHENDFDEDIHRAQTSPVYESTAPEQFKATVESDDSGDDMGFGSTVKSWLKRAIAPTTSKLPGVIIATSGGSDGGKVAGYQSESEESDDIDPVAGK
ncbi:hypothetical protein QFC21_005906 [Naganishia friedmannii]|uniref:Uncharacterized protein n=1 Tax=Naganishia friedmannii TaxID=89922 RepID=A0ACC2V5X6_9TREE|nr:hypothetical protein QFC21_005906 [Naganishia friedmannii]